MAADQISEQELAKVKEYIDTCIQVSSSEGDDFQKKTKDGQQEHPILAPLARKLLDSAMKV